MGHVLGADSHASNWREPVLSAALKRTVRLLGSETGAKSMVTYIPQAIIADRDIAADIRLRTKGARGGIQLPN